MWSAAVVVLVSFTCACDSAYTIGVGIADVTGPPTEITMLGYGSIQQKGIGIHLRQFSRAFIFRDDDGNSLVFVSVDSAMMGNGLRRDIIAELKKDFGSEFTEDNVMISSTHTHSTPGGFMQDLLFDISTLGFVPETYNAMQSGIVRSITRARQNLTKGRIYIATGELLGVTVNRSPLSYLENPESERKRFKYDTDKTMVQLRLVSESDVPLGAISWYPVHPTSMNNTNRLVSSDNIGYASVLMEKMFEPGSHPGKTKFVAAFASSNLGDVSPNTKGPRCEISGEPCDPLSSTCPRLSDGRKDACFSLGPGGDMFNSTYIVARKLAGKAQDLWESSSAVEVTGPIRSLHQWVYMPNQTAEYTNTSTGETKTVKGCFPAMGYSFAAGTTDGPGASLFVQGTTTENPLWNLLANHLSQLTREDIECHAPKPILLPTGRMSFPFEWQPSVVSTHLATIGNIAVVCLPGEFTTMAGRRVREAVQKALGGNINVIIAGLCNTYSDYVTTPEEYQIQRYEGASTIFGPYTLPLYLKHYEKLALALYARQIVPPGPDPPELMNDVLSLTTRVLFDMPPFGKDFGYVLEQPQSVARPGDLVTCKFVSGSPRNNIQHGATYLTVERLGNDGKWSIVATDAYWETKFYWKRTLTILGNSEVTITWEVPETVIPGQYRIRHFGHNKKFSGGVHPYTGSTQTFKVDATPGYGRFIRYK